MQHNWKSMMERLNDLYYGQQGEYQQALYEAREVVYSALPGMTIVFAEAYDHTYQPAMTHMLAPNHNNQKTEKH